MRAAPNAGAGGHDPIMGDTEAFVTPWPDSGMRRYGTFRAGRAAPGQAAGYRAEIPPSTGMTAPLT